MIPARKEIRMTAATSTAQGRDLVVRCIGEAYEALRVIPGVNANGPALVWVAEQFLQVYRRGEDRD
jgi:hypothetical protein